MKYELEFCVGCYLPEAMRVARALLTSHAHDENFEVVMVPGEAGAFEVRKDGLTAYSKKETGRLPAPNDIELGTLQTISPKPARKESGGCC
jgi:selT/selW/selH-like putative selenoprotein